jgi:BESS motif
LRDNFRIQWKMIPRDENDQLLVCPDEFTGTKWQYYRPLLFLADNMGKSRNSYNHYDDSNYELLHQFEPAIEIPSDDDLGEDLKPDISPKLHQRLLAAAVKNQREQREQRESSPQEPQNLSQKSNNRPPPKLRAIPQLNLMDVHSLLARSTSGQTTISPAPLPHLGHQQLQNAPSSSTSSNGKRRKTDEVTTSQGCGASSNDDYPTASSPGACPNSSNDDDYHFLMSLQPYLTQFTGPQKLRIRMRIQKLIFKELYKDDIDD